MKNALRLSSRFLVVLALGVAPLMQAAQTYKVDIVFLGVMTYDTDKAAKTVTVIIPNLEGGNSEIGDDGHALDPHIPYVLAEKTSMPKKLNGSLAFINAFNDPNKIYHYALLQGEEFAVDPSNRVWPTTELDFNFYGKPPCPEKTANVDSTKSMLWIESMSALHASPKKAADRFLSSADPSTIAARTMITFGSLEAHVLEPGVVWAFKIKEKNNKITDTAVLSQALAQEVHWRFDATGDPFVLNLVGTNGNAGRRIAFNAPQNNKPLVIVVGNTTARDTGALPVNFQPQPDPHYAAHHQFVDQNESGKGPIPFPDPATECSEVWQATLQTTGAQPDVAKTISPAQRAAMREKAAALPKQKPMQMPMGPNDWFASPGGLNCSGSLWP